MSLQPKINKEYASLVPQLSKEEYESLKQSIKEHGLYVPIIVNQDGIILDGHHRFRICQELEIEPKTSVREFKEKLDEQLFVIDCNLKRRQLNNFQRVELALKSKSILTEIAKKNMSLGGKNKNKGKGSKNLETLDSKGVSEEIGKLAGVSHETVRKVEKILSSKYVTDKIMEDLRTDAVSINQVYEECGRGNRRHVSEGKYGKRRGAQIGKSFNLETKQTEPLTEQEQQYKEAVERELITDKTIQRLIYEWTNKTIAQQGEVLDRTPKGKHWASVLAEESTDFIRKLAYQMTISALHRRLEDIRIIKNVADKFGDILYEVYEIRKKTESLESA